MDSPTSNLNKAMSYVKSPLNYTGGKYKLLKQIVPMFPEKIDTFVDLFAGGCNVAINVEAKKVIANDISKEIIELYNFLSASHHQDILDEIEKTIQKYGLSNTAKHGYDYYGCDSSSGVAKYNKEAYQKLRQDYNKMKTPFLFYVTVLFSFNNQIRFNRKGDFNMPVNKRDFNDSVKRNLMLFIKALNEKEIEFHSKNFTEVEISDDSFVYIDPPYLATTAAYNENGGWNEDKEVQLLDYMDGLNERGIRFALSNVFENKGKSNELLKKWSKRYHVHYLENDYKNCNYQAKDKTKDSTSEILITNYQK